MKKILPFLLLIIITPSFAQDICKIYFWDNAGSSANFISPDPGDTRTIRSVEALRDAVIRATALGYPFYDVIEIVPVDSLLPDYHTLNDVLNINFLFITLGWMGSGSRRINSTQMSTLTAFIDSSYRNDAHGIYIEGNDMAYDYADTNTYHYTTTPIMERLGATLRFNDYGVAALLNGNPGSLAEGLTVHYNTTTAGATLSMDDMIMLTMTPYTPYVKYVFDAGKGPARGMQRRTFPGFKRDGRLCGSMVGFAFNFGNIIDLDGTPYKAQLMYRILDFLKPPRCNISFPAREDTLIAGRSYNIIHSYYDNCGTINGTIKISYDGGLLFYPIHTFEGVSYGDTLFSWTVPNMITDAAYINIYCEDKTGQFDDYTIGPFCIIMGSTTPTVDNLPKEFRISNVYPNPFNSNAYIEISTPTTDNYTIQMFDLNGRLARNIFSGILSAGISRYKIEQGDLHSGLYLIRCGNGENYLYSKITLIK